MGDGQVRRADRPASPGSLVGQWRWLERRYPGHALLVQVGNQWECAAGPLAARTTRRPGLAPTQTLAPQRLPALRRWLTRTGQPWVQMTENGHLPGGLKRRQVCALWPGPDLFAAEAASTNTPPAPRTVGAASAANAHCGAIPLI